MATSAKSNDVADGIQWVLKKQYPLVSFLFDPDGYHQNMDIRAVRRKNFELLIQEADTIANLARITQTSDKYLRHIFNGFTGNDRKSPRQVGDDLARKLEAGMGKPHGWMDVNHDTLAAQNDAALPLNPRQQALLQLFESVTESDQQEVLRLLSEKKERRDEVIADWLKKQSKKSAA